MRTVKLLFPANSNNAPCHPCNSDEIRIEFVAVLKREVAAPSEITTAWDMLQCGAMFRDCQNHNNSYAEHDLRSMSVGDIVCIDDERYYILKGIGWERVEMYKVKGEETYLVANMTSVVFVDEPTPVVPDFSTILCQVKACVNACHKTDETFQMRKLREECAELLLEDLRHQDGREGANPDSEAYDVLFRALAWLGSKPGAMQEFGKHLDTKFQKYKSISEVH